MRLSLTTKPLAAACALALLATATLALGNVAGSINTNADGTTAPQTARFYIVPNENMRILMQNTMLPLKSASEGNLNLVRLTPDQVEQLSSKLHGGTSICGGFIDAQVQMEQWGFNPQTALHWAATRPQFTRRFNKAIPTYPNQVEKALSAINPARFTQFLTDLTAFPDRFARDELGTKASKWLAQRALELAQQHNRADITVVNIPTGQSYTQDSVLVRIAGQDPAQPGVLVGGHMDTYQNGKPGADDDGTGTATVMEAYNALLDSGVRFKRDVYFAFYAAEEWGLYGSQEMAAEFVKRRIALRGVLQFDMTGFKSPNDTQEIYFINDHTDLELTKFLKQLTLTYVKIPAQLIGDTRCGYACSDHASWTNAGYAAAFPFEAGMENYNKTLHTPKDTMSLLNPEHMLKYLKLAGAFVVESADPLN